VEPAAFNMSYAKAVFLTATCWLLLPGGAAGENWPRFRGATGLGYTEERNLPLRWNQGDRTDIVWQAPLVGKKQVYCIRRPRFATVTEESGVRRMVRDHYAAHPEWWLSGLHLADLDGDDELDLFLSSHGRGPALAALNDGRGRFTAARGSYPSREILAMYDSDEDGALDVTMTYQDGGARWWRNRSRPGELRFEASDVLRGTNTARRQSMVDIDRDGKVDWLRGRGGRIAFDRGDGAGNFAEDWRSLATGGNRRAEVLCLPQDLDGDGDIDLLAEWGHYGTPASNSRVYLNDGKMHFEDATARVGLAPTGISIKGTGDFDQDGDPDLICLEDGRRFTLFANDGRGLFERRESALQGAGRKPQLPSWGIAVMTDFDNDGIADILANGKHYLKLWRGTGAGKFTYANSEWGIADVAASSVDDGICFGDVDSDGDLDIVGYTSAGGQRQIAVYRNDVAAGNWIRVRPVGLPGNRGAGGAKIRIYAPGTDRLLWYEQVAIYNSQAAASYYGLAATERHFGLGERQEIDVSVEFYPSGSQVWSRGARANEVAVVREEDREGSKPRRGPVVNVAADGMVECLVPPVRVDGTHSREDLIQAFHNTIDYYAEAGVPYLFLNVCYMRAACPSKAWDTYWDVEDPEANTSGWPQAYWLAHKKGVDPFAVSVARCRERGISPWMSVRMNDTHYIDDPTKTARLWQQHPELRRAERSGYDFAEKRVRDHYLALIAELMDRYDCDGVELDWMRFPRLFKAGREQQGLPALNDFVRRAHQLADQATVRRKHPVKIAARVPALPESALGLGMDAVTWAREGWVDMLVLSAIWRPSDTDIPVERWRQRIGPAGGRVLLAAATDLWLQGTPGGKLMADDLESQRGFTAAALDRGADLVYLFNHFNVADFRRTRKMPDGRTAESNEHPALLAVAGRLDASLAGRRRHVVTYHDPPPGRGNRSQLPARLAPGKGAQFRVYTGPKPTGGRVMVRAGLGDLDGAADAKLAVRLNGVECKAMEDLTRPEAGTPSAHDPHRVFDVAHLARRMVQFGALPGAIRRGYNQVELRLTSGSGQQVVWMEIYIVP
jgi:hypothetical protein